jgi:hypothetical protein
LFLSVVQWTPQQLNQAISGRQTNDHTDEDCGHTFDQHPAQILEVFDKGLDRATALFLIEEKGRLIQRPAGSRRRRLISI